MREPSIALIWHVNGDDPEAVVRVAQMAFDFRQQFKKDVVIDIVCYRRHGHNEGDDPTYTQPLMYQKIKQQPTVLTQYAQRLIREKVLTQADVDERKKALSGEAFGRLTISRKRMPSVRIAGIRAPVPAPTGGAPTAISREAAEDSDPRAHDYCRRISIFIRN